MSLSLKIGGLFVINDQRLPVSLDQTSSFHFEKPDPELIRCLCLRAIVGKTTMGSSTAAAMRELLFDDVRAANDADREDLPAVWNFGIF